MRLDLLQVQKCIFYCDHFVVRFVNEGLGTLTINVWKKNQKDQRNINPNRFSLRVFL